MQPNPTSPSASITDTLLEDYDVLISRSPGGRSPGKTIDAVERFHAQQRRAVVHRQPSRTSTGHATYLNSIAQRFGFRFRYDSLLGIDKPWEDHYEPPLVPRPDRPGFREMDFATSTW